VRDYVHVCDLANAHVSALDHLFTGRESASVNLGTGHGHSIREVIPLSKPSVAAKFLLSRVLAEWEIRQYLLRTLSLDRRCCG
jgi:UDP-glucose 4-epimerase